MTEKKDVLEYLRNRQKAAEIEAKVNGINLWVLLGAIGVVSWQLLSYDLSAMLSKPEPIVRTLMACEAAYLFSWLCSPTRGLRSELRYTGWRAGDVESPLLVIVEGLWTLLPPLAGLYVFGKELSSIFLGIFGVAIAATGVVEIFWRLRSATPKTERFPKPDFRTSPKSDVKGDLVVGVGFLLIVWAQARDLWQLPKVSMEELKAIALLGVLYLLCMVAIRRRRASHSIQWTYELETDVVLGSLSPDGALRRIEHRALGPKLEDVMNKFFDELDEKLGAFELGLASCRERLASVSEIPRAFQVERADRIAKATTDSKKILDEIVRDLEEFSVYLGKLSEKKQDARVANAIDGLTVRKRAYADRIASAKATFENITRSAAEKE